MPRLRVAHTIHDLDLRHGGPSRSVPGLCAALPAEGVDPDLMAWVDAPGFPTLRTSRPAVVHDHGLWRRSNVVSSSIARRLGVPHVVSTRGMLSGWALRQGTIKKGAAWIAYQRTILQRAALLHVTSEGELEDVRRTGLTTPVAVIPNGVDAPGHLPLRTAGPVRRALFLSRVHPVKGLPMLVEAWMRVCPAGWELVIAGPDEAGHRAEVEARVRQVGLDAAVQFLGPVMDADKWALYRSADLFVLPTHTENFGLVIAEALAASIPVLTTTAAPWHLLEMERCGWWAAPTADAIAEALASATALPRDVLAVMGERGRGVVERDFGWASIAARMYALYAWLLGEGERPPTVQTA